MRTLSYATFVAAMVAWVLHANHMNMAPWAVRIWDQLTAALAHDEL